MTDTHDSTDTDESGGTEPLRDRDPEARARALQSLLTEKSLVTPNAIDDVISMYEDRVGPLTGAKAVAHAWTDDDYRHRLLENGLEAVAEVAPEVPDDMMELRVVENTPDQHNLVVCTLCSCYPWAVLGLPPTWYKTPAYRSRAVDEPRALLGEEFDTEVPEDVDLDVWDSNSEIRYMVLPQQPPGTADLDEEGLREHVTRNSMLGVERLA